MTKVLGICGSASPKSSTKKLIESALLGAKSAGAEVEFIDEAKLTINGCHGCLFCKTSQEKMCSQNDDMTELYEKINASDALIIGAPIYFGEGSGQIKCFIDRLYAFAGPNGSKMQGNKKAVAILTQGYEDILAYAKEADTLVSPFKMFGAEISDPLIVGGVHTADDLKPETLNAAEALGKKLVS